MARLAGLRARFRLATLAVGDKVPLKVIRAGKEVTLTVPLAAPPEDPPRDKTLLEGRQPLAGATVVNMSPAVAEEMGLSEWRSGVTVTNVQPGSYAARFLRPGDMIVSLNGETMTSVADVKAQVVRGVAPLSLRREGMVSTIQFR